MTTSDAPSTVAGPDAAGTGDDRPGPGRLVLLGTFLGIGYGFLEVGAVGILAALPGGLAWRTGNALPVLWFAPAFHCVAGALLGLLAAAAARVFRSPRWDAILVGVSVGGGLWLGGHLPPVSLGRWPLLLLSAGVGVQAGRWFRGRSARFVPRMARSVPFLAGTVAVLAVAVTAYGRIREASGLSAPPKDPNAPNVLLIVVDTLRGDRVHSLGYPRETTPHLDAIAAEGASFESAHANSSWTLPSHASLFTGRLPHEHRAGEMRRPFLDDRWPTVAEHFLARGYATGGFVANGYWCGRHTGLDRGFVRYEDFYGSLADAVARTALGRILAYDVMPHFGARDIPGRKNAYDITDDYLAWLDDQEGRPTFAFLNYFDVHAPYSPAPAFAGKYRKSGPESGGAEIEIGHIEGDMPDFSPEKLQAMRDLYDECLESADDAIGRLVAGLRSRGALDRTIVVITSDHGESFGEHGLVWHGHSLYRELTHAPLIVRWPGVVPAGRRIREAAGIERIPATLVSLLGHEDAPFPGTPLPVGDVPPETEVPVVCGVARRSQVPADWPTSRGWVSGLATRRWHFLLEEDGSVELYDILEDPEELKDRSGEPEHAGLVEEFRRRASGLWER